MLAAAGMAAGVISTVAGMASLVSYPALLAVGLPPLSANVTNTVALLFTGAGAAAGSRPELAGQGARVRRYGLVVAAGGAAGAAVLLTTPAMAFERAAPVLIGGASLVLLRPGMERPDSPGGASDGADGAEGSGTRADREHAWLAVGLFCAGGYIGYFGAAGGIVLLAILTAMLSQPLARTNALKNVISGMANCVAAVAFAVFGPVRWAAVGPLAAGFLAGGMIGPAIARRVPGRVLRIVIGVAGVAVAIRLALTAYR